MSELRVPTLALSADVVCADGRLLSGRLFVPVASPRHSGAMGAGEWLNEAQPFFPFLADETAAPVLLNKRELVMVSLPLSPADEEAMPTLVRTVVVDCGGRRLQGRIEIAMPEGHSRLLDYLNQPESFVALYEADRVHLVQKQRIARVVEVDEA